MVGGTVAPLLISHASADERFREHPGLSLYGIESYIAVPLNRRDGSHFGTLCTLDPNPTPLTEEAFDIFHLLAQTIAFELEADEERRRREADLRALEDVISIAGHDLRQPLTVLFGQLQLLARRARRGIPSGELADRADALIVQTRRALALSDNLLDVAQLGAGALILRYTPCDLAALVCEVAEEARLLGPSHTFVVHAPPALVLAADRERLSRVLGNLLGNAVKYVPPMSGPVTLTLTETATSGVTDGAEITVQDTGAGVTDAQLTQIFERRYRTSEAQGRGIGGSGLGLFIVRQIVEAHGGTATADHAPGGGLLIRIRLPLGA